MTTQDIIHAINAMNSKDDLEAIQQAAKRRLKAMDWAAMNFFDLVHKEAYEEAFQRALQWPIGTTVYPWRQVIRSEIGSYVGTPPKWGEPLIVRSQSKGNVAFDVEPSIRFEHPPLPEPFVSVVSFLNGKILYHLDCRTERPIWVITLPEDRNAPQRVWVE